MVDAGIRKELDLEVVEVRLLESGGNDASCRAWLCDDNGRVGKIQRTGEASRDKMENLLSREISHDLMKNVHEVFSRFMFLTNVLKLGLRFPERRAQRLHLVSMIFVQTRLPLGVTDQSSPDASG